MRNMGKIGVVLLWVGFLAGSFVVMREADRVAWGPFAMAAAVGVLGVVLIRGDERRGLEMTDKYQTTLMLLQTSLDALVDRLSRRNAALDDLDVYEVHRWVDAELAGPLADFADNRELMIHSYGLQSYAKVMTAFATGERYINRVWSASADGYIDEVKAYLPRCQQEMEDAQRLLREASSRA